MPKNSGMMHCGILFSIPYSQHIATKLDGAENVSALKHSNSSGFSGDYMYKSDKRHVAWNCGIMLC